MQNTIIAVQADIEDENDVSQTTALVTFARSFLPPSVARPR